jgi:glycerol-3-phosphate dehydrogenase
MAADAVDAVVDLLGRGGRSRTAKLRLHGADGFDVLTADLDANAARLGIDRSVLDHLVHRYGGGARTVAAMISTDPALGETLVDGLPYLRAEVVYAARYEMAGDLDDILTRRIPLRWLDARGSAAAAADAAALAAPELGWSGETEAAQVAAYRRTIDDERAAAGLGDGAGVDR